MAQFRVLSSSDYKEVPWKNLLGTTVEIGIYPPNTEISNFVWRISTATVSCSCPFSFFKGYNRILIQLEGEPMKLIHTDKGLQTVKELTLFEPYSFSGDLQTSGEVTGTSIVKDFNIMTLNSSANAKVVSYQGGNRKVDVTGDFNIIFCCIGRINYLWKEEKKILSANQTLWLQWNKDEKENFLTMEGEEGSVFIVVNINLSQ